MSKVTRDEIIGAAVKLFNESGYHATSMRVIARSVDIKKPSLYHHFDSKEQILLAILETGMDQLISEVEAIADSDLDCEEKLRHAIHAHAQLIASNPDGAAVFLREDRGLGSGYLESYVERRDHFEALFKQIVNECIDSDVFGSTDVSIAVHGLLGMVNWMTRWYRPEGRLSASQIADIFADLFIDGLRRDP